MNLLSIILIMGCATTEYEKRSFFSLEELKQTPTKIKINLSFCKKIKKINKGMPSLKSKEKLHPPFRFSIIEEGFYRGSYPKERNFTYLERLQLKTILSLIPSTPTPALLGFSAKNCMHNIHVSVDKPKENIPLTFSQINKLLQIILDKANYPMYIHCLDGTTVTGMVIACLRKLQCWTNSMALMEYARFLSDDGNALPTAEESELIEKYQTDMEIRLSQVPSWIHASYAGSKHPTLKIKWIGSSPPSSSSSSGAHGSGVSSSSSRHPHYSMGSGNSSHHHKHNNYHNIAGHVGQQQQKINSSDSSFSEIEPLMQSSSSSEGNNPNHSHYHHVGHHQFNPSGSQSPLSALQPTPFLPPDSLAGFDNQSIGVASPLPYYVQNVHHQQQQHQYQQRLSISSHFGTGDGASSTPVSGTSYNLNSSSQTTSSLAAALKAEKEQLRQRHLDLGLSMSRRDTLLRKELMAMNMTTTTGTVPGPPTGSSSEQHTAATAAAAYLHAQQQQQYLYGGVSGGHSNVGTANNMINSNSGYSANNTSSTFGSIHVGANVGNVSGSFLSKRMELFNANSSTNTSGPLNQQYAMESETNPSTYLQNATLSTTSSGGGGSYLSGNMMNNIITTVTTNTSTIHATNRNAQHHGVNSGTTTAGMSTQNDLIDHSESLEDLDDEPSLTLKALALESPYTNLQHHMRR